MTYPFDMLLNAAMAAPIVPDGVAIVGADAARDNVPLRHVITSRTEPLPAAATALLRDHPKTTSTWAALPDIGPADVDQHLAGLPRRPSAAVHSQLAAVTVDRVQDGSWDRAAADPLICRLLAVGRRRIAATLSPLIDDTQIEQWLDVLADGAGTDTTGEAAASALQRLHRHAATQPASRLADLARRVAPLTIHPAIPADQLLGAVLGHSDGSWRWPAGQAADLIAASVPPATPATTNPSGVGTCLVALHAHPDDDPAVLIAALTDAYQGLTVPIGKSLQPPRRWLFEPGTLTLRTALTDLPVCVGTLAPVTEQLAVAMATQIRDDIAGQRPVDVSPLSHAARRDPDTVRAWLADAMPDSRADAALAAMTSGTAMHTDQLPDIYISSVRDPAVAIAALTVAGDRPADIRDLQAAAAAANVRKVSDLAGVAAVLR